LETVDAHTHIGLTEFVVREIPPEKLKKPAFQDKMYQTFAEFMDSMDSNRVDRAVVFPFPLAEADADLANSFVLDAWKERKDRIIPFALVDERPLEWAARGFRGFKQHFLLEPERFDAKRVYPQIASTGMPLVAHFPTRAIVQSAEAILALAPDIKLIIAHMGRCEPFTGKCVMENVAALAKYGNVYFETSTVRDIPTFRAAVAALGASRICFGSDIPFGSRLGANPQGTELDLLGQAIADEDDRRMIFGGTILSILGEA
jgi:predicted TIM-barrel fold metal-dependent hydrolase